jgi:hypothetical protein
MENSNIKLARISIQVMLIRNCIYKSKAIITANAFKLSLRNAAFFLARFPFVIPSTKEIKSIIKETDNIIYELKKSISASIKNLIGDKNITIGNEFWFNGSDLRSGYVLLYPHMNTDLADYVLLLVETKDPLFGDSYFPGDIIPYKIASHILKNIKGLSEKELGIAFTFVNRLEILNELSILKSSLKIQNQ